MYESWNFKHVPRKSIASMTSTLFSASVTFSRDIYSFHDYYSSLSSRRPIRFATSISRIRFFFNLWSLGLAFFFYFRVNYPSRAIPPVVIFKVFYNMQRLQLMSTVCQSMGGGMDGSRVNCGESIIYIYLKLSVIITRQRYSSFSSSSFNCVRK